LFSNVGTNSRKYINEAKPRKRRALEPWHFYSSTIYIYWFSCSGI